jgi:hypothetical protein
MFFAASQEQKAKRHTEDLLELALVGAHHGVEAFLKDGRMLVLTVSQGGQLQQGLVQAALKNSLLLLILDLHALNLSSLILHLAHQRINFALTALNIFRKY